MERKVNDMLPARRDVLRLGGYGLLGASLASHGAWWLPKVRAAGKTNPRGTARSCILIEVAGAISHCDTFDFKETEGTPKDLDVRAVNSELYLSYRLFPELSSEIHGFAIVRSMKSHETIHDRGQYYTQTGRPLNPIQAPEIPSIGSVISYELEAQRRESDSFPTYIACNLGRAACGALSNGFLHPRHSVLDINVMGGLDTVSVEGGALELLQERYGLLAEIAKRSAPRWKERGRTFEGFRDFQSGAMNMLGDPRWPQAFRLTPEEKKRYGDNEAGLGCLLARNLIQADAGTRYVHIVHPDWDHHKKIFDHTAKTNHYIRCNELDRALTNLVRDLSQMKSPRDKNKSLLDETLVAVVSEFGRVPGPLNGIEGRHHYNQAYHAMFAGAGVKSGRILGKTDSQGEKVIDSGWRHKSMQTKPENICATVYSCLGIDWKKEILNTPSKRAYRYVDVLGATEPVIDDEIAELFA